MESRKKSLITTKKMASLSGPCSPGGGEAPAEKYFSTKMVTPLGIAHEGDDVCIYVTLDPYEYLVASEKYFSTKMVTPLGIEPRSPRPQRGILTTKLWRLSTLSTLMCEGDSVVVAYLARHSAGAA